MTAEEFYKKEFGNAEQIPKESVIRLLGTYARQKAVDVLVEFIEYYKKQES